MPPGSVRTRVYPGTGLTGRSGAGACGRRDTRYPGWDGLAILGRLPPQIRLIFLRSWRGGISVVFAEDHMRTTFALVLLALTLASGLAIGVSPTFAGPKQPVDCTKC